MESSEEVAVAVASYSSNGSSGVECDYGTAADAVASFAKRKQRTKRLRTSTSSSPPPAPNEEDYFSTGTTATEEEEDMAHCLILLAQGRTAALPPRKEEEESKSTTSRKFAGTATTATGAKAGFYVYECKTCNKCFPSFQALGGHRASHKKPKLQQGAAAAAAASAETTPAADHIDHPDGSRRLETTSIGMMINSSSSSFAAGSTAPFPAPSNNNKQLLCSSSSRVHECSICGSEFASGQALGGHMRRHRPVLGAVSATAAPPGSPLELAVINSSSSSSSRTCKKEEEEKKKKKKKKCMLSLDLNLPAPSEENAMAAAVFAGFTDQRPLALVDCHY